MATSNLTKEQYQNLIKIILEHFYVGIQDVDQDLEVDITMVNINISKIRDQTNHNWRTIYGYTEKVRLFLVSGDISFINFDDRNVGGSQPTITGFLPENREASLTWLEDMNPLWGTEEACAHFQCSRSRLYQFVRVLELIEVLKLIQPLFSHFLEK